ncbi:MAG: YhcH/YjgK/YiaL family protein [Fusobacteriaceae bacterium]
MIFDKVKNIHNYKGINKNLDFAIEEIIKENYKKSEVGKHEVDGKNVFYNTQTYTTKDLENCFFETHKDYIDIQLLVKGEENMAVSGVDKLEVTQEYNPEKDVEKQSGECETVIKVTEDSFVMFFPGEPHMPGMKVLEKSEVKKVVFKAKN